MPDIRGSYTKPKRNSVGVKALREELGRYICKLRIEAKLEQQELAELCGYNYNIVNRWENGQQPYVTTEDTTKITEALNLPKSTFEPFSGVIKNKLIKGQNKTYRAEKFPEIAKRIAMRMEEARLTGTEFSRALELYPQHIYGFVNAQTEPRLFYVKKMLEILFPADMQMEGLRYLFYGTPLPQYSYESQLEKAINRIKALEQKVESLKKDKIINS